MSPCPSYPMHMLSASQSCCCVQETRLAGRLGEICKAEGTGVDRQVRFECTVARSARCERSYISVASCMGHIRICLPSG